MWRRDAADNADLRASSVIFDGACVRVRVSGGGGSEAGGAAGVWKLLRESSRGCAPRPCVRRGGGEETREDGEETRTGE